MKRGRGIALDMLPGIHLEFYPIMNLTAGVFSKHSYSIKLHKFINFDRGKITRPDSLFLVASLVEFQVHFLIESNVIEL